MDINDPRFWHNLPFKHTISNAVVPTNQQALRIRARRIQEGSLEITNIDDGQGDGPGGDYCTGCRVEQFRVIGFPWTTAELPGTPTQPPDEAFGDKPYTPYDTPGSEWDEFPDTTPYDAPQPWEGPVEVPGFPPANWPTLEGKPQNPHYSDHVKTRLVSVSNSHILVIHYWLGLQASNGACSATEGACAQLTGCTFRVRINAMLFWYGPNYTAPTEVPPTNITLPAGSVNSEFVMGSASDPLLWVNTGTVTQANVDNIATVEVSTNCGSETYQMILAGNQAAGGNLPPAGWLEKDSGWEALTPGSSEFSSNYWAKCVCADC